ncbi:capsular exopolysaccharide synthesis family protein [Prosthecobacter fusiformis]|uniref:Capsular exopolysaccharide synthesis family protein n=1 Tax=Prosthecobacter fusiformis TaxID=48464 RepID=A0A4R7S1J2_9BACT|nr:polysaccharide biosynthesis tyrosine autokinase [Prosthecobacter fusiformis]TDU71376.1 capsular exopolysaccharide synthesis family protein [Prosthecobacter fusiformis]
MSLSSLPPQGPTRLNLPKTFSQDLESEADFDWRGLLITAREKLWLLILLPLIGAAVSYGYLKQAKPVFSSNATLEVEEKQRVVDVKEVTDKDWANTEAMNTLAATMRSSTFLERLIDREKLQTRPDLFGGKLPSAEDALPQAVGILSGALKAAPRVGTRLLDITATHGDPIVARDLAVATAKGVMKWDLEQRSQSVGVANEFLMQEAERLRKKVELSEQALQKYRVENNAVSLEENQNLVVSQLQDISSKLSQQTNDRVRLETDYAALLQMKSRPDEAVNLQIVANHPTLNGISTALAARRSEFAALQSRYKSKHPKYTAAQSDIANLEARFREALPQVSVSLEASLLASLESAKVNEKKLQEALAEQEKKSFELDALSIEYNVRKREMESDKAVYESVISRLKEVDLTKGMDQSKLKLHQLPSAPGYQIWPQPSRIISSGVGGGFALAAGVIFLLFFMDRTIKSVDQAEKILRLPVLATINKAKYSDEAGAILKHAEHSPVAESFRSLRVMANLLGKEEDRRVFVVTSALPSEGKTFCSCNYALSLAQQGLKTLLIDADLRRPKVSASVYGEDRKPGLTEYLLGQATFTDVIHSSPIPAHSGTFRVIPAGFRSPNPAELLASNAFPQLLELALKHFDRVVIDTAPIVAVSDTLVIVPHVQTVLLVIHWKKTPSTVIQRALNLLGESGKSPSGLILNNVPEGSRGYYYHYSPGYYGSKGVYGASA